MNVTSATLKDVPRLCELLAILFEHEIELHPDEEKQAAGLTAIISSPATGLILTLRHDGKLIGMVNLLFSVSTFLGVKVAWLEDVIVDPLYRRQGGGKLLVQTAILRASELGCRRLTLLTDGTNTAAQEFYRRLGFAASAMVPYRRMLDADPGAIGPAR